MFRLAGLFSIAMTLAAIVPTVGQEPHRPGQETFISRAVFADGQLWLISDAGILSSISEGKDDPVEVVLPEAALDLWVEDGQPAVISCSRPSCTNWILRRSIQGHNARIAAAERSSRIVPEVSVYGMRVYGMR